MKKRFLILLFISLILSGCKYDMYKTPKDVVIKIKNKKIPVYSNKYHLYDLIEKKNVEIISDNKLLKTNKIGNNYITLIYKYKRRKYKYKINYKVVDKVKPIFLSVNTNKTILLNEEVDFCEKVVTADNYDRSVSCVYVGDLDNTKTGNYKMKYIISDGSNNVNELNFNVNVIEKYSTSNYSNSKKNNIEFNEIINSFKNDNTLIGIDVSRWQNNIDFEKVKNAGCEFVIIRMAVNTDINKDISLDSYYKDNIKKAKKAGLKVGIYVYSSATDNKTAKEHAKFVIKHLNKEKLDFPIAYDWENWDKFNTYKLNMHDISSVYAEFDKEITKHNYKTMLYSSKFYLENIWMNTKKYNIWLAHYNSETSYSEKFIMWQLTNIGKIDGIDGDVDIDIYYKK